jgi:hypothetical protein
MTDEVTPDYIRARWAYSELLSPSFGHFYVGPGVAGLKEKARQGGPFGTLTVDEGNLLALQFNRVRGGYFNPFFTGVTTFKLVQWTKDRLGAVAVIPYFLPELGHTLGMTFKDWIEATPTERPAKDHPRCAADDAGSHFTSNDPVTAGRWPGFSLPVLLDGYHRAVRFWKTDDPADTLAVYVPLEV